jgi:flagellin
MSLRINLNSAALQSSRVLRSNDDMVTRSIERLSSGYKINRAADNPAGLAISEALRAQIGGLKQAISNTQDAVNMVKTAEGALTEVHSLLRSMRDLAVHALNTGAVDATQLAADQAQIRSAIEALNRIADTTAFGGRKLLDGTAGVQAQVTSGLTNGQFISGSTATKSGTYTITINTAATQRTVVGANAYTAANGAIIINNVSVALTATDTAATAVAKINLVSGQTGVTASQSNNIITLTSVAYGSGAKIDISYSGGVTRDNFFGGAPTVTAGVDVVASFTGGSVNASNITGNGRTWTGPANSDLAGAVFYLNGAANSTLQVTVTQGSLQFQVGSEVGQTAAVNVTGTAANKLGVGATGLETSAQTVADIDVTTTAGARDAVRLIDQAIKQVSTVRGDLGAVQKNVFESAINSLSIAVENIMASESSIRDTDIAAEISEFTKAQILMNSSIAMLAQANQAPQALLQLLR